MEIGLILRKPENSIVRQGVIDAMIHMLAGLLDLMSSRPRL